MVSIDIKICRYAVHNKMRKYRRYSVIRKSVPYVETPPKIRPKDLSDTDISFDLDRLFDPYNLDHVPEEERLNHFKRRDLAGVKYYKAAALLFRNPMEFVSRKRIINAPPMETLAKHKTGVYLNKVEYPPAPRTCVEVKEQTDTNEKQDKSFSQSADRDSEDISERERKYKNWLQERQKFRSDLDDVALNTQWLKRKPDKTEIEKRVLGRMIAADTESRISSAITESTDISVSTRESPTSFERFRTKSPLDVTSPWGIRILERHLRKNKMRLIDLFKCVDKDKNWKLSREEFKASLQKTKITMSDALIEDLITSLDVDCDGSPNGKSLQTKLENQHGYPITMITPEIENQQQRNESTGKESELASRCSTPQDIRCSTPQDIYELPSYYKNIEKDKERKSDSVIIKTGNKAVDDHCMKSTMKADDSDAADLVDKFRQLKLKEYYEIIHLCQCHGVPLTEKLLERVLLYPAEKPETELKLKLRNPEEALFSRHFADPPPPPPLPIEVKQKHKIKRSESGRLLIDTRHVYPLKTNVAARCSKANLSTGRALIRRKVDCWMTFEEYEHLTRNLAIRFKNLYGKLDENVFWPGHLLQRFRLCMPPYDKPEPMDKKQ
ncbi:hypothetical protein KUTeg_020583, partial [Tegillarca granosa]